MSEDLQAARTSALAWPSCGWKEHRSSQTGPSLPSTALLPLFVGMFKIFCRTLPWRLRAFTLADRRPFLAHQSGPCVPCFGMTTWTLKTPFHRASFQGDPHSHPLHRGTPPPPPTSATEPARPGPRKRSPRPTRSLRRPVRQSGVDRVLGRPLGPGGLHQEGGGASDGGG